MHTGGTQTATCITPPVLYLGGQGVPSHNHFISEASRVGAKSGHAEHLILKLAKVTAQAKMGITMAGYRSERRVITIR